MVKTKNKTTIQTRLGIYLGVIAAVATTIFVIIMLTAPEAIITTFSLPSVISVDSSNSVNLTWTAPGDDGQIGTAQAYDIRYHTVNITEDNWEEASQVDLEPEPEAAGSQQSLLVTGLIPNTQYYFALKTVDEAVNWSALSNIASKKTDCFEAWSCTDWSICQNGQQNRTCIDLNSCGTEEEMPAENQSCQEAGGVEPEEPEEPDTEPEICQEDWQCTDWSICSNQLQTRTCTDTNDCGTEEEKPGESRECDVVGGSEEEPEIIYRETYIVTGTNQGGGPQVRIFDKEGNLRNQFFAFPESFRGGINVFAQDLGQDGVDEIIVGAGPGYLPMVRIFDSHGNLINTFQAYENNFQGGVNIAAGNLDGKGVSEIVVAPQSNGGPHVRIFGYQDGQYLPTIQDFFAYNVNFRGGISLQVCDLDREYEEIITIPNANGGPHLRIFGYRDGSYRPVILGLMTHHPDFRGGINIGCGDIEGNGYDQIAAVPAQRGGPHIRTFGRNRERTISILSPGFMAFHPDFRGGVSLSLGDFDYDYDQEIVAAVNGQDKAWIRIFYKDGTLMNEFLAYPDTYTNGINIATARF